MDGSQRVPELSKQARSLWAKTDRDDGNLWLPLFAHLCDASLVAERLWHEWLPVGVRRSVARYAGGDEEQALRLVRFLAAAHDIGKATPVFQAKAIRSYAGDSPRSLAQEVEEAGLPFRGGMANARRPTHALAGQIVAERYFEEKHGLKPNDMRGLTSIIGAHHGQPPLRGERLAVEEGKTAELGWDDRAKGAWAAVQFELLDFACALSGFDEASARAFSERWMPVFAESILCGLVIMADWIASNQGLFPLVRVLDAGEKEFLAGGVLDLAKMEQRAAAAWDKLGILPAWEAGGTLETLGAANASGLDATVDANATGAPGERSTIWLSEEFTAEKFAERFDLPAGSVPRPLQQAAIDLAGSIDEPGIMVVEAPMGEGKTEAALAAAEILCARTGRGGVCVALPTMATTDAMFDRVNAWLSHLPCKDGTESRTVYLAHGKAQLNETFQSIVNIGRDTWRRNGSVQGSDHDAGREHGSAAENGLAVGKASAADNGRANGGEAVDEDEAAIVSRWMFGRKKGVLANFVVCTVDQVLMGALAMKHLPLRQLALANKVVIVDECHAYDAYMQQYLASILSWLGAWRTPVILLSATLPSSIRETLVSAYVDGRRAGDKAARPKGEPARTGMARRRRVIRRESSAREGAADASLGAGSRTASALVSGGAPNPASVSAPCSRSEIAAYPLIAYSDGLAVESKAVAASGRETTVSLRMMADDDASLEALLAERLSDGGCAGVVCDTVPRAQAAAAVLARRFGKDAVVLTHARFMDIDRMENEKKLRDMLGPKATVHNGQRPQRLIVVGTQVLEQSLDIDFDVMVADVAPADLLMQRLGRLHRHARGAGQADRPEKLREARCYVRGVTAFESGAPCFAEDIKQVYDSASLLEMLAVLELDGRSSKREVVMPQDISQTVQNAYGDAGVFMPASWQEAYRAAVALRSKGIEEKKRRANSCLVSSADKMVASEMTMENLFGESVSDDLTKDGYGEERGQLAVRDTQETIEVLLAWRGKEGECEDADGFAQGSELRLLPWVGNLDAGVPCGARIPANCEPPEETAKLLAQCAVRLPLSLCSPGKIGGLIEELKQKSGGCTSAWTDSTWLSGKLLLVLKEGKQGELCTCLCGRQVGYSRETGFLA